MAARAETRPVTWVVGAGGLLGRHVVRRLGATGHEALVSAIPWADTDGAVAALREGLARLHDRAGSGPWSIAWCAGAGVVATGADALANELAVFGAFLDEVDRARPEGDGALFVASSAGGLYAGCSGSPYTEATVPAPLVAYGRTKLAMEERARLSAERGGLRLLLGRIANLYGPGQRLTKPQGLISQICLTHATGRPLPVYVSTDTLRDYIYAPDAAAVVVAGLQRLHEELPPGGVVTKILASGRPVTVGHLIGEARRVLHRPLRTIPLAGAGTGQVLDLRFRSTVWTDLDAFAATPLPAGLAGTAADVGRRVSAGGDLDAEES